MLALLAFLLLGNVDAQAQSFSASNDSATEYSLVNDAQAVQLLNNGLLDIEEDYNQGVAFAEKTHVVVEEIISRMRNEGLTLEDAIDNTLDEMLAGASVAVRGEIFNRIIGFVEQ